MCVHKTQPQHPMAPPILIFIAAPLSPTEIAMPRDAAGLNDGLEDWHEFGRNFLVEDFTPDRIEFDMTSESEEVSVGETAAIDIKLLHEAAMRAGRDKIVKRPVISSWTALLGYVRVALANEPREQFRVLFLEGNWLKS